MESILLRLGVRPMLLIMRMKLAHGMAAPLVIPLIFGARTYAPNTARCTHMLFRVILQCETPTKITPEARPRRVGPKRRGRARESGSRFVDMNDQWTFIFGDTVRDGLRQGSSVSLVCGITVNLGD